MGSDEGVHGFVEICENVVLKVVEAFGRMIDVFTEK